MSYLRRVREHLEERLDPEVHVEAVGTPPTVLVVYQDDTDFMVTLNDTDVLVSFHIEEDRSADVELHNPSARRLASFLDGAFTFAHTLDQTLPSR